MNKTIFALSLQYIRNSPFFTTSPSRDNRFAKFDKLRISHSLDTFYFSSSNTGAKFSNSLFTHSLARAITVEKTNFMINKVYEFTRLMFTDLHVTDDINIENCQFRYYNLPDQIGGAMFIQNHLEMWNVLFDNITAREGGAFATQSSVSGTFLTLIHCQATESSGGFAQKSGDQSKTTIKLSTFFQNKANLFGSFYRSGKEPLYITDTNFSKQYSTGCVAVFENSGLNFSTQFTQYIECEASIHNGGLVLRNMQVFSMDTNLFLRMSHHSNVDLAGAAILIYELGKISRMLNTSFIECHHGDSHTISVDRGGPFLLYGCAFSDSREKEIHLSYVNLLEYEVIYGIPINTSLPNPSYSPGFIEWRTATPDPEGPKVEVTKEKEESIPLANGVVISAFIGVVVALLFDLIQRKTRRFRSHKPQKSLL